MCFWSSRIFLIFSRRAYFIMWKTPLYSETQRSRLALSSENCRLGFRIAHAKTTSNNNYFRAFVNMENKILESGGRCQANKEESCRVVWGF
jgi:hypothetical protein